MESLAFGARPARFIFSMKAGGERRECEAEAGFPQPPPGRSASPAPGPHSPLATAEPQEPCCQAGHGGGALWLWRLGEMPQSQPASQTRPDDRCTPQVCPAPPSQPPCFSRGPLGTRKPAGVVSEWPGMLCKAQQDPTSLSLSTYLLLLHTQYSRGWSLRPKPKADQEPGPPGGR